MDNNSIKIEIVKIFRKSSSLLINQLEKEPTKNIYVDYDTILNDIRKSVKKIVEIFEENKFILMDKYITEEELMLNLENLFFDINFELEELISIYEALKSNLKDDDIHSLLVFQMIKKVFYDYIVWCNKVENAIFEIDENKNIICYFEIDIEAQILNYVTKNTKSKNSSSCLLPFLGGIGLGFLLDD